MNGQFPNESQKAFLEATLKFRSGLRDTLIMGRAPDLTHAPDLSAITVCPDDPGRYIRYQFFGTESVQTMDMTREEAMEYALHRPMHSHDFFELLYVSQGQVYQQIESERHLYTEGSLCLLNRNIRHQEEYLGRFCALFLALPASFVEEILDMANNGYFPCERQLRGQLQERFFLDDLRSGSSSRREYIDFIPITARESARKEMQQLFDGLMEQYTLPVIGSTYRIKELMLRIFCQLSNGSLYTTVPLKLGNEQEEQLFDDITSILKKHSGRISRTELEKTLSYSGDYLNRVVKKYTGKSLLHYGMEFCMQEAAVLLTHTDMPVSEICKRLKFSNQTHFYKAFQQAFGQSPGEYRKLHRLGA